MRWLFLSFFKFFFRLYVFLSKLASYWGIYLLCFIHTKDMKDIIFKSKLSSVILSVIKEFGSITGVQGFTRSAGTGIWISYMASYVIGVMLEPTTRCTIRHDLSLAQCLTWLLPFPDLLYLIHSPDSASPNSLAGYDHLTSLHILPGSSPCLALPFE